MGDLINFPKAGDNVPHATGDARCTACGHKWVAVSPVGECHDMECPNCGAHRGEFDYGLAPQDSLIYVCWCGNDFFHVVDTGVFCTKCGIITQYSELCED